MRELTKNQIAFEAYSLFYILPYKRNNENNEEILEKTANFLEGASNLLNKVVLSIDKDRIIFSAEYEGYSSYYDFELHFELIDCIEDDGEKRLMLLGYIYQDEHDLFEEIINDKILPKIINHLRLKSFY